MNSDKKISDIPRVIELYSDMINELKNSSFKDSNDIDCSFANVGSNYTKSGKRIMFVGRAMNGWSLLNGDINMMIQNSMKNSPLDKIDADGNIDYVDSYGELRKYNYNTSAFFQFNRLLSNALLENPVNPRSHIFWSNLYKLSPNAGGNPSAKLIKLQLPYCIDILKAEIDYFEPTDIIIVAGDWWWIHPYDDRKSFAEELGIHKYTMSDDNNLEGIIGYGKYKDSKIVVCKRPERIKRQKLVDEVILALDRI